ncbi:MAG: tetratricopeptide repeat protein [Prochlorothrix sp.]
MQRLCLPRLVPLAVSVLLSWTPLAPIGPARAQADSPNDSPTLELPPEATPFDADSGLNERVSEQYFNGDFEGALATLAELTETYRSQENWAMLGEAWNGTGLVQEQLENWDAALEAYQQAIDTYQRLQATDSNAGKLGEARTLNNMGGVYTALEQPEAALGFLERALVLFRELGAADEEAITLTNVGGLYGSMGRPTDSIEVFQQALGLHRAQNNQAGMILVLDRLSTLYAQVGAVPEAVRILEQGSTVAMEAKDTATSAAFLSRLGELYSLSGDLEASIGAYERAIAQVSQTEAVGLHYQFLTQLALVKAESGDLDGALGQYQAALALLAEQEAPLQEGELWMQMALLQSQAERWTEAQTSYDRALTLIQPLEVPLAEGQILRGLGSVALEQGDLDQSRTYLEQALDRQRSMAPTDDSNRLAQQQEIGLSLSLLAAVDQEEGNYDRAKTTYQEALQAQRQGQDLGGQGETLRNLAVVSLLQGQPAQAAPVLLDALDIWEYLSFRTGTLLEPNLELYQLLQATLVAANQTDAALLGAEQGRSLPYRLQQGWQQGIQSNPPAPISLNDIKQVAQSADALLLFYDIGPSLPPDFAAEADQLMPYLRVWLVSPGGEIAFGEQPLLGSAIADRETFLSLLEASQTEGAAQTAALDQLAPFLLNLVQTPLTETTTPRLVVLPPPLLQAIPYDLLPFGDTTLGDRFEMGLAPAIQVLIQ